jgi:hypothetical protein
MPAIAAIPVMPAIHCHLVGGGSSSPGRYCFLDLNAMTGKQGAALLVPEHAT